MDHQPFEELIFSNKNLMENNKKVLSNHLSECRQCADLSESWNQIESVLMQSTMVSPRKGFTSRFAQNLVVKKQQEQQRQSIKYLVIIGIVLLGLTTLLITLLVMSYSPGQIIIGSTSLVTSGVQAFINIRTMVYGFLYGLPPLAISAIWLIIAAWGMIMTPIWGVAVWKATKQGVVQK